MTWSDEARQAAAEAKKAKGMHSKQMPPHGTHMATGVPTTDHALAAAEQAMQNVFGGGLINTQKAGEAIRSSITKSLIRRSR